MIDKDEVLKAINDYLFGEGDAISKDDVIEDHKPLPLRIVQRNTQDRKTEGVPLSSRDVNPLQTTEEGGPSQ